MATKENKSKKEVTKKENVVTKKTTPKTDSKEIKKVDTKEVKVPKTEVKLQKVVTLPIVPKKDTKAETKKVPEQVQEAPKPETKPEVKTKAPKAKSAGATIREVFFGALDAGLITADVMAILTSAEKTKEVLKIRYAFLKQTTSNPDDRKVNGNARYNAQPVVDFDGKQYWITNDLYTRNVEPFKKWIESLKK